VELLARLLIVNVRCQEKLTELLKALSQNDWGLIWLLCIWVWGLSAPMHLGLDLNGPFVPHDWGYCEAWKVCMEQCVVSDGKCFERDNMGIQQFQY